MTNSLRGELRGHPLAAPPSTTRALSLAPPPSSPLDRQSAPCAWRRWRRMSQLFAPGCRRGGSGANSERAPREHRSLTGASVRRSSALFLRLIHSAARSRVCSFNWNRCRSTRGRISWWQLAAGAGRAYGIFYRRSSPPVSSFRILLLNCIVKNPNPRFFSTEIFWNK